MSVLSRKIDETLTWLEKYDIDAKSERLEKENLKVHPFERKSAPEEEKKGSNKNSKDLRIFYHPEID